MSSPIKFVKVGNACCNLVAHRLVHALDKPVALGCVARRGNVLDVLIGAEIVEWSIDKVASIVRD